MDPAERLFREYLHLRSRMVVYAAITLALLGIFALFVVVSSTARNLTRFGLALEWLAVLAVVPHLVGLRRPAAPAPESTATPPEGQEPPVVFDGLTGQPVADAQTAGGENAPSAPAGSPPGGAEMPAAAVEDDNWEVGVFRYYQKSNGSMMLGNLFAAIGVIWLMFAAVLYPETLSFPEEAYIRAAISLVGFAWLNLFMLVQILLMAKTAIPGGMLAGFFTVDFLLGFIGVVFAGIIHILRRWVGRGLGFIFQNGARRVLLAITLPFLLLGLGLQIWATFLP